MGMFSMIDAILDRPMEDAIGLLPLPAEVRGALLGEQNKFREILETVVAYEQGDWKSLSAGVTSLGIKESDFPQFYLNSLKTTQELMEAQA